MLLAAACASAPPSSLVPPELLIAIEVADELERDRQFALAREQLAAAAEYADTPDRGDALRLRACELWIREGDLLSGRFCYEQTVLRGGDEPRARALYRAAAVELELGDAAAARAGMVEVARRYPATDAAERALRGARALAREQGGAAAEVDLLLGMAEALRTRATAEDALERVRDLYLEAVVVAARRRLEDLDDAQGAEDLLGPATAEGRGAWLDDATLWRARALARLGRHDRALELYQRMLDERETSWFVGSYDSVFLDDALFERAELLERLGRAAEARAGFELLADEVPDSRLVDDAAFRAARLTGERSALEDFVREHPDSRHVPEARRLLGAP